MLLHGGALPRIAREAEPVVWSGIRDLPGYRRAVGGLPARFEPFPDVKDSGFGTSLARRLVDYAWDGKRLGRSRASFWRLRSRRSLPPYHRLLRAAGACAARLGLAERLERWLEPRMLREERSAEAEERLRELRPDLVVVMSPFRFQEPAVAAAARRLGVRTAAFVTSWDNLSTKSRTILRYDGWFVWSEAMREELHRFYPYTRGVPVGVTGAPQFDVFFDDRFRSGREEFCARQGLDPRRRIVLYGLGSPNLLREHFGVEALAGEMARGRLPGAQLLVRPHPLFHEDPALRVLERRHPFVRVQASGSPDLFERFQDAERVREWVDSVRHADVVVNLSSTLTIDAALLDRPVVNLDYDPEPGSPNGDLVREINHVWDHFRPIAESGAVALASGPEETVRAVEALLADPSRGREARRRVAAEVCGPADGRAGERLGEAVLALAARPAGALR